MSTLKLFKNYNNYYNRIIKHDLSPSTMDSYTTVDLTNANFNPGDGVTTQHVINWTEDWLPDYLMVDPITSTDKGSFLENGLNYFSILNNNVQVFRSEGSSLNTIIANRFYDLGTKELDLNRIANYENQGYGDVDLDIEGDWALDSFSLRVIAPNSLNWIKVWSDSNEITINSPTNVIINREYLISLGWDTIDDFVWGIEMYAGSPDTFYGSAICKDYNSKWISNSSWFVMSADRLRKNQYNLTLKKDNIADHYNVLINSPAYIEKATI